MSVAPALLLGFLLGLKHAVDADHLAAVATIVSARGGGARAALVGAAWGLGHGLALLPVAVAVIVLRLEIAPRVEQVLEGGVALMLIALALDSFRKLAGGATLHVHLHRHADGVRHLHPHFHTAAARDGALASVHDDAAHRVTLRPVLVGLAHGLAGSAALMLLVLTTIPEPLAALLYVVLFALGATLGMIAMGAALGAPLRFAARRWARAERAVAYAAGSFSLVVGLSMLYRLALREA